MHSAMAPVEVEGCKIFQRALGRELEQGSGAGPGLHNPCTRAHAGRLGNVAAEGSALYGFFGAHLEESTAMAQVKVVDSRTLTGAGAGHLLRVHLVVSRGVLDFHRRRRRGIIRGCVGESRSLGPPLVPSPGRAVESRTFTCAIVELFCQRTLVGVVESRTFTCAVAVLSSRCAPKEPQSPGPSASALPSRPA